MILGCSRNTCTYILLLLPRELSPCVIRERVLETNSFLYKITKAKPFLFIEQSSCWTDTTDKLNVGLYHKYHLYLVKSGNKILVCQMANAISVSLSKARVSIISTRPPMVYSKHTVRSPPQPMQYSYQPPQISATPSLASSSIISRIIAVIVRAVHMCILILVCQTTLVHPSHPPHCQQRAFHVQQHLIVSIFAISFSYVSMQ